MSRRNASRMVGVCLATAVALAGCAHPAPRSLPTLPPGLVLPAAAGGRVELAKLRGKVVLIDVWATWCEPCRKSLPRYRELYTDLKAKGFVIVGVNVDERADDVRRFLEAEPLPFPVALDPKSSVPEALALEQMPTAYLVDRTGKVRSQHEGFDPREFDALRDEILALLAE